MTIMVTGGAGYIGTQLCITLMRHGHAVIAVDDLRCGDAADLIRYKCPFASCDVSDREGLAFLMRRYKVEAVVHLAAYIVASESVDDPLAYYNNNVGATIKLLEACVENHVRQFVFASTAAVYGAGGGPISESAPLRPATPYAKSKLMVETMLPGLGIEYVVLRLFNVVGADPLGYCGQRGRGTHIVKRACQAATGKRPHIALRGTPEQCGVRDYIHVADAAEALALAAEYLGAGCPSAVLNCGLGKGLSTFEVFDLISAAAPGIKAIAAPATASDLGNLIADTTAIRAALNWTPIFSAEDAIWHALAWEKRLVDRAGLEPAPSPLRTERSPN